MGYPELEIEVHEQHHRVAGQGNEEYPRKGSPLPPHRERTPDANTQQRKKVMNSHELGAAGGGNGNREVQRGGDRQQKKQEPDRKQKLRSEELLARRDEHHATYGRRINAALPVAVNFRFADLYFRLWTLGCGAATRENTVVAAVRLTRGGLTVMVRRVEGIRNRDRPYRPRPQSCRHRRQGALRQRAATGADRRPMPARKPRARL